MQTLGRGECNFPMTLVNYYLDEIYVDENEITAVGILLTSIIRSLTEKLVLLSFGWQIKLALNVTSVFNLLKSGRLKKQL